ncbi:MAG: hypothetical protein ABFD08_11235 [Syntrophomonas sp.]
MKSYSPVSNCYRAILSLVNHLDNFCPDKSCLVEIYEELTELAFYIMEDDCDCMTKGIEQLKDSITRLKCCHSRLDEDNLQRFKLITGEIKTHLDFLKIEHCNKALNKC